MTRDPLRKKQLVISHSFEYYSHTDDFRTVSGNSWQEWEPCCWLEHHGDSLIGFEVHGVLITQSLRSACSEAWASLVLRISWEGDKRNTWASMPWWAEWGPRPMPGRVGSILVFLGKGPAED